MRIAVDLLGGDHAPAVVVDGALRALAADAALCLLLVGPAEVADQVVAALAVRDRVRVTVRLAHGLVAMGDDPTLATRAETTVSTAVREVVAGAADAVVSAGSTGATVTAAVLGFGRWPGVRRPALAATLPALAGPVVLLDVGGSLELRPPTMVRHAVLGAAYAAVAHGVSTPRVGLLSIGTEAGKGDRTRRAVDAALSAEPLSAGARYVGLVEGYDVPRGGRADVVVTDGASIMGMVTDRDIVVRAVAERKDPASTSIGSITKREVVMIDQSSTASEAAALMRDRGVRRVLVCDADRQLVGIVSLGDLAVRMDPESALGEISGQAAND